VPGCSEEPKPSASVSDAVVCSSDAISAFDVERDKPAEGDADSAVARDATLTTLLDLLRVLVLLLARFRKFPEESAEPDSCIRSSSAVPRIQPALAWRRWRVTNRVPPGYTYRREGRGHKMVNTFLEGGTNRI